MNKMDEKILAVDRLILFDMGDSYFEGVLTERDSVKRIVKNLNNYIEVRRGDAEENEYWKQPIPYSIIKRGRDVFLYKRLKSGGEKRLHDQLSIGVGGHMNRVNDIRNWNDVLKFNMYREINEELSIKNSGDAEPEVIGLINDDQDEVGLYHIGILSILELPEEATVEVKETDTLEGFWIRIKDLKKTPLFENLESWSQIAVDVL